MSFLASEFGISLNRQSDHYLGRLKMSQVDALVDGYSRLKAREADAIKQSSNSSRVQVGSVSDLKHMPGVIVKKKAK